MQDVIDRVMPALACESASQARSMTDIASPKEAKTLLREFDLLVVQREGPKARTSVKCTIGKLEDGSKWEISVLAIKLDKVLAKT